MPNGERRIDEKAWRKAIGLRLDSHEKVLEHLVGQLQHFDDRLGDNTAALQQCTVALGKLTEETTIARQLQMDGISAIRLTKMLFKPVIVIILTGTALWAGISRIVYNAWPGWYVELLKLLK